MTEIKSWVFWRAVAAEFVGMLLFIFIGISAIVGKDKLDFAGAAVAQELKVALAFALAIATLAQSLGHISGAHLNPAVTLGLLVSCQISLLRCICYILAQMLGAVAASAIVNGFRHSASLGVNKVRGQSCHVFFFTFILQANYCDFKKHFMYKPLHSNCKPQRFAFSCSCLSFAAEQSDCRTRLHHRVPSHPSAGSVCDSSD